MNLGSNGRPVVGPIYSSLDVAGLTGVSLRQLQWWDEQGVVTPMQKGRRRLYNPTEVLLVSVIVGLRRKKLSLQKIRRVVDQLKGDETIAELAVEPTASEVYLLTDGDQVSLQDSAQEIIDIQVDSSTPMTLLRVSDHLRKLGWIDEETPTPRKPVHVETSSSGGARLPRTAASKVS